MIQLVTSHSFGNAISRARKLRPMVRPAGSRAYVVESRNHSGMSYVCRFFKANHKRYGVCSCIAGEANKPCYHLAAAAALHIGLMALRLAMKGN